MAKRKKILIIEDNDDCRKLLKSRFIHNGYDVITCRGGMEGLNRARKDKPDLIILDILLPNMNGLEICRLLKFDKKYHQIPVVILTSYDANENKILAKQCGADIFLVKTTRSSVILGVVKNLLAKKET